MKNSIEICKDFGFEVPADKHADFLKAVAEEYKTNAEHGKVVTKLETATKRAETAEETLKSFEGIDPAKLNDEIASWKKKAEEAEQAAQKQIAERDFNDALNGALKDLKITSAAARKSVEAEIRAAGLTLKDGKILGLTDLIEQIKAADASAFVDDGGNPPARFTAPNGGAPTPGKRYTMGEIMKMKNENPNLDIKQFMNNGGNN